MAAKHMNVLFPHWQGAGPNMATYEGAMELKRTLLEREAFVELPVSLSQEGMIENDIWGFRTIVKQFKAFKELLDAEQPDTLFTIGGGDDVEVIPLSYINHKLKGDMTVAFFDAHGDLNSPASSPSKHFHGMPLRALLGESDPQILNLMYRALHPAQLVMVGTRDCDPQEWDYIKENRIQVLGSEDVGEGGDQVLEALKAKGSKNLYLHIDIDVLDPEEFPYQPVPASGGLKTETFSTLLGKIRQDFHIAGLCLLGFTAMEGQRLPILQEIVDLGLALGSDGKQGS